LYGEAAGNGYSHVSMTGDTLYFQNGSFVIIPGLSEANNNGGGTTTGTTLHTCGAPNVHNSELTYGSMTDQEGNMYKTIVIGTQEWMAENLNTSIYRNGDAIITGLSNADWQNTLNTQQGAWAYYNDDSSNTCPYGKLYNWYACADARELCPVGWHVPAASEWTLLADYLGGSWYAPNVGAINVSGFSAVPAGIRCYDGNYSFMGQETTWWCSNEAGAYGGANLSVGNLSNFEYFGGSIRSFGYSVRCVRD
jgi:uncharacterized protein (TIGR02145 family)